MADIQTNQISIGFKNQKSSKTTAKCVNHVTLFRIDVTLTPLQVLNLVLSKFIYEYERKS